MENKIGDIIKYHRKKSGLTRQELAEMAGVGKTVVFDIEHGKETVRLDSMQKILKVLNIELLLKSPLMKNGDIAPKE